MPSRVLQVHSDHLATLDQAGVPYKDVTARERHLKLTINRLKCDLAGDSEHYSVVERAKFAGLSRVAAAAAALPLEALAEASPRHAAALRALGDALAALRREPPRAPAVAPSGRRRTRGGSAPRRGRAGKPAKPPARRGAGS